MEQKVHLVFTDVETAVILGMSIGTRTCGECSKRCPAFKSSDDGRYCLIETLKRIVQNSKERE